MIASKLKPHRCKAKTCKATFMPWSTTQIACSTTCAMSIIRDRAERAEAARLKRERLEWREKLAESKPISYWLARAQKATNALRREMDIGLPCYTCATYETVQREAGHYRSRGSCSSARFDIARNLRTQCHFCNVHLSGNLGRYRAALVAELGEAEVQALEAMPKSYRWTREECQAIEADAKAKLRDLISKRREAA